MIKERVEMESINIDDIEQLEEQIHELQIEIEELKNSEYDEKTRIKEQLKRSEVFYRTIFDNANDAIFILKDGVFVECNKKTLEIYGFEQNELIGKYPYIISPEFQPDGKESKTKALEKINKAISGNNQVFEWVHTKKDGSPFYTEVSLTKIDLENEIYVLAIVRDITQRIESQRKINENENRFKQLVQNLNDIIVLADENGNIIYESPSYERIMGYSQIGKDPFTNLHPDDIEATSNALKKVYTKSNEGKPILYRVADVKGNWHYFESIGTNLLDNPDVKAVIINSREVTEKKFFEKSFQESEERFKAFIEQSTEAIVLINEEGKIVIWNLTSEKMTGISSKDAIGKYYYDISFNLFNKEKQTQNKYEEFKNNILKSLSTGIIYYKNPIESFFTKENGEIIHFYQNSFPIKTEKGYCIGAITWDLTDLKNAQSAFHKSEKKYYDFVNFLPQIIFEIDLNGTMQFVNEAALNSTGYTSEDIENGLNCFNLISPKDQDKLKENIEQMIRGKKSSSGNEYLILRKDGTTFPAMIYSAPIFKDDQPAGFQGIIVDITERIKAEQKIKQLNDELEIKVLERTNDLNNALEKIQLTNFELQLLNEQIAIESQKLVKLNDKIAISESNLKIALDTKDKFFSIIAHDLRNPIGGFCQLSELLSVHYNKMTEEEKIEIINSLSVSSKFSYELLNNLLDWARTQTGSISFNPNYYDLNSIIEKVYRILKLNFEKKNITFENQIQDTLVAYFDNDMITTVFRNLISNAVKFTNTGGIIKVRSKMVDQNNLFIIVEDNGTGMTPETIGKLFQIDKKVTTEGTQNEKGTGLGLIICNEFIALHGGKIWVESEIGEGSKFIFTLSLKEKILNIRKKFQLFYFPGSRKIIHGSAVHNF